MIKYYWIYKGTQILFSFNLLYNWIILDSIEILSWFENLLHFVSKKSLREDAVFADNCIIKDLIKFLQYIYAQ